MSWIWSLILGSTEKRLKKTKHPQTSKSRGRHTSSLVQTELCPVCHLCANYFLPQAPATCQWPPGAWLFLQHATTPFLPSPCRVSLWPWESQAPMPVREQSPPPPIPCPQGAPQLINKPQKHFSSSNALGIRADRKEELFDLITWLCPTEPFTC